LEVFQGSDDTFSEDCESHATPSHIYSTLSTAALSGVVAPRTMFMSGVIQDIPVCILVDSGSSHTFVSADIAAKLTGVSPVLSPIVVQVANGAVLSC
jgi:hypothetical protein